MATIRSFEDLEVWQKSKQLVVEIYGLVGEFPREETFGVTSQIKRSALSVPANIAEGFGRYHFMDKAKFYLNARGSLYELKSHLLIASEVGLTSLSGLSEILGLIEVLSSRLNTLINTTRQLKASL